MNISYIMSPTQKIAIHWINLLGTSYKTTLIHFCPRFYSLKYIKRWNSFISQWVMSRKKVQVPVSIIGWNDLGEYLPRSYIILPKTIFEVSLSLIFSDVIYLKMFSTYFYKTSWSMLYFSAFSWSQFYCSIKKLARKHWWISFTLQIQNMWSSSIQRISYGPKWRLQYSWNAQLPF